MHTNATATELLKALEGVDPEWAETIRLNAQDDPDACPGCLDPTDDPEPVLCAGCTQAVRERVRRGVLISPSNQMRAAVEAHIDRAVIDFYADEGDGDPGRGC